MLWQCLLRLDMKATGFVVDGRRVSTKASGVWITNAEKQLATDHERPASGKKCN